MGLFGIAQATAKNWLVCALLERALEDAARRHLKGRLIDIGCATKPYASLLAPYVSGYVGVDHAESLHGDTGVDLPGDAYRIPVPDESFDSAVCTAVLEHLEEPEVALRECWRVLAPGGAAVYSIPFIWHLHEEPRDFYRFTPHGLRHLFGKAGFEIIELRPLSGFWTTFATLLSYKLDRFQRGPLVWLPLVPTLCIALQAAAWLGDRVDRAEEWSWMHLVVARKPRHAGAAG